MWVKHLIRINTRIYFIQSMKSQSMWMENGEHIHILYRSCSFNTINLNGLGMQKKWVPQYTWTGKFNVCMPTVQHTKSTDLLKLFPRSFNALQLWLPFTYCHSWVTILHVYCIRTEMGIIQWTSVGAIQVKPRLPLSARAQLVEVKGRSSVLNPAKLFLNNLFPVSMMTLGEASNPEIWIDELYLPKFHFNNKR